MRLNLMRKWWRSFALTSALALFALIISAGRVTAQQSANLLVNPGMEKPYVGEGASNATAPTGWSLWSSVPVIAFPETQLIHGGYNSWNIRTSGYVFTAGGHQQVSGIPIGSTI